MSAYLSFFHTHKKTILMIGIIGIGLFGMLQFRSKNSAVLSSLEKNYPSVEVFDVETILNTPQVIEAHGSVETLEEVDLSSEVSARVARVSVALGDTVRRGQTLVVLSNADLAASRSGAQADLESALANRSMIEAQYAMQEATIEKIWINGESTIATAALAVQTAENNLRQSALSGETQVVRDAYSTMVPLLFSAQDSLFSVLNTVDSILGIDDTFANDDFEDIFSVEDTAKKTAAIRQYHVAKDRKAAVDQALLTLSAESAGSDIDAAIVLFEAAFDDYRTLLLTVSDALDATPRIGGIYEPLIDGLKTNVQSARGTIVSQSTQMLQQKQAIDQAKNSFGSLQIAYDTAVENKHAAEKNMQADLSTAQAQLDQIQANLDLQDAQIQSAHARISGVNASIAKTIIRAPISGTIATLPAKVGELMEAGQLAARIVNTEGYQITTYIAAEDVSTIAVGNIATIADRYEGVVTHVAPSVDPTTNKVEVRVLVTSEHPQLVSEQFVSVRIERTVEEDALFVQIPLESVRLTSQGATVLVVNEWNMIEERIINIGQVIGSSLEADIRDITEPIISSVRGLDVGQQVVIQNQ